MVMRVSGVIVALPVLAMYGVFCVLVVLMVLSMLNLLSKLPLMLSLEVLGQFVEFLAVASSLLDDF